MSTEVKKYTFVWEVENFSFSTKDLGESIISPYFTVKMMDNTNWILKYYPRGISVPDNTVVTLYRDLNDSGPVEVKINYKAFILASDGSFAYEKEKECVSFIKGKEIILILDQINEFLRNLSVLSTSDILTICCQIWESTVDQLINAQYSDRNSKDLECLDEILETACEEISKESTIGKLCHFHPTKFFARTNLEIERRSFHHQIIDFSNLPNPRIISFIPECGSDKNPQLLLTLNFDAELLNVDIGIGPLLKKMDKSFLVKFIIKVVPTKGSPISVMNDFHLYRPTTPLVWKTSFEKSNFLIDENLYLNNDILTLHFELVICKGTETSSIEELCYAVPLDSARKKKTIMDDLLQFYEKQKYCDVKLQVGNETIQAHRAVLCSRSPIFREMFESDISENKKVITDADMTTLKCMLLFMYTENIESLKLENVLKLYSVADKYQYEALRKQCSLFLASNIQLANVCEVLILSNNCGDDELKTASLDYIRLHANEVFGLQEWKSFVRNNILLASEALGYVSSAIQKSYIESRLP
ncbi:Speckle-type POZ protein [Araneus ventricosus]|uniref:Speckle-type POZ protein n=1 Tax=Araneus ventricosus TaxID=182803 RepID=A0A4Y2I894_ARAVE|nr:Speckle-type POZ protein [Araneus ventricosus]